MLQHLPQMITRRIQQMMKPSDGLYPMQSALELLQPHRALVGAIRQYFGVPESVWASTHEQLLHNFTQRVQLLPASEHAHPGGLLRHSLETVNHAMKIRRGYMLPTGATSEHISEQQEIWNFAVFSTALLHNIGINSPATEITWRKHKGNAQHWPLVSGDMPIDALYRLKKHQQQAIQTHLSTPLLIAGQLVPQTALQWLNHYPDVFNLWCFALTGQYDKAGVLSEIIGKTSHTTQAKPQPQKREPNGVNQASSHTPPSPHSESITPQNKIQLTVVPPGMEQLHIQFRDSETNEQRNQSESEGASQPIIQPSAIQPNTYGQTQKESAQQFVQWLRQQIIGNKIGFNEPSSQLHTVKEGLFLATPLVFTRYLKKRGDPKFKKLEVLQIAFLSLGLHKTRGYKQHNWTYCYQGSKENKILEGILIPDPLNALALEELPDVNPLMSVELSKAGNNKKPGAFNDNINLTTGKT